MSNLGFHAALRALSEEPGVFCERAFLDPKRGGVGLSYDSGTPLSSFDVVAFSVSFEADFLGLASLLDGAGIPVTAGDRSEDDPLVVMGGICASLNPEPVAPLLDAVLVGDADSLVPGLASVALSSRGQARVERLRALARLKGFYVPSLYAIERNDDGTIARFVPTGDAPLPVRPALDPAGGRVAESVVLSTAAHFEETFLVEMSRGCAWDCRFCAAGHVHRPARFRPADDVVAAVEGALPHTRRVGLVSAALVDHPESKEILARLIELGVELNVSSLRAERIDREVAELLAKAGVRTVTVAPETGREDLREIIGKAVSDEEIIGGVRSLAEAGIPNLKLYFMVGVPGEIDDDIEAIVQLVRRIRSVFSAGRSGVGLAVSVSAFTPKPRTPFQWLPMADEGSIRRSMGLIRRRLARERIYRFTAVGPREGVREGVLARGGRELARAIVLAATEGLPWKAALRRTAVDARAIVAREYGADEMLPWDIVEVGVGRERLLASLATARSLMKGRRRPGAI